MINHAPGQVQIIPEHARFRNNDVAAERGYAPFICPICSGRGFDVKSKLTELVCETGTSDNCDGKDPANPMNLRGGGTTTITSTNPDLKVLYHITPKSSPTGWLSSSSTYPMGTNWSS
jgi:hypothetical protein